jgi:hypothetical protein
MATAIVHDEEIGERLEAFVGDPCPRTKFEYAWALVHSEGELNVEKGIAWLKELARPGDDSNGDADGSSDGGPSVVDCLYFQAIGEAKLGHVGAARRTIDALLAKVPGHPQALRLRREIEASITEEAVTGAAILGSFAVAAGAVAYMLFKKK